MKTTIEHLNKVRFSVHEIRVAVGQVEGFNAKFAVVITRAVGTMACAYLFALIAFVSLPAVLITAGVIARSSVPNVLSKPGLILIVAWIAQTFLQLVLLSIIMVGQNVQSVASDARSEKTYEDATAILDRLDVHTAGGITAILDRLDEMAAMIKSTPPGAAPA